MSFILSAATICLILTAVTTQNNFEEVTTPPPQQIEPTLKCGEGEQKGRFICVPYFNCDPDTNTITEIPEVDGSHGLHPRGILDSPCDHPLEVCCGRPNATPTTSEHVPTLNLTWESRCGIANISSKGSRFKPGEFPWLVQLLKGRNQIFCGGSLVSPVTVLTAAHCVEGLSPQNIKIRVHSTNGGTYQVAKVIVHEHYLNSTLYNDVALIILQKSVAKNKHVGTVCLPTNIQEFNKENCFSARRGNGRDLKKFQMSLVPSTDCQKALRTKLGEEFVLDHSFVCADGCNGDGGNPLVCSDSSSRFYQAGIVSWSTACGKDHLPGVYSNVTLFRDWVEHKLRLLGYNTSPYTA